MQKKCLSVLMMILMVCILTVPAVYAADSRAVSGKPFLSFDGNTATCIASCKGNSTNDALDVTLTLYQEGSFVDSWSDSGTGRVYISGECQVKPGKSYKLELVYSMNGKEMPSASVTGICP